ncbi:MAG TPA: carboxypeptidase regulatory-like domain-containing protein, partial [Thermoanaerobaculia bacterium]
GGGVLGDFQGVVGFQPLLLAGTVSLADSGVQWAPTAICRRWLQSVLLQRLDPNRTAGFRLLVQVILKGNFIWSADDPEVFLDGESFGRNADGQVDLRFPSGDGRRGGDFETWFWLVPDAPTLTASASGNVILGSLHDAQGSPVAGVRVSLVNVTSVPPVVTDAAGNFRFPQVPNGRLTVQAQIPGGPTLTQDVQVGPVIIIPNPPVNPNPVILNPVVLNPLVAQPAGPVELGEPSAQPAPAGGAPRLTDVRGIGRARAAQLAGGGINTAADLAAAEPARVAEVLGVPEETARTLVESARAALGS